MTSHIAESYVPTCLILSRSTCRVRRLATSRLANIFGNGAIYRHDKKIEKGKTPEIYLINRKRSSAEGASELRSAEPEEISKSCEGLCESLRSAVWCCRNTDIPVRSVNKQQWLQGRIQWGDGCVCVWGGGVGEGMEGGRASAAGVLTPAACCLISSKTLVLYISVFLCHTLAILKKLNKLIPYFCDYMGTAETVISYI